MSFAHLHVHTEYSLLDGFAKVKKLVSRAYEMDMPAVAITDHGTMFGVIEFYLAAIEAGVKPIIGLETYLAASDDMTSRDSVKDKRSTHLLLLAENEIGYKNLLHIASDSQLKGFYYHPRIDHAYLADHADGLICTSGCLAAEIPQCLRNHDLDGAKKKLDWYYQVFGKDRFFLELQGHDIPDLKTANKHLYDLAKQYNAQFVATNDVHYVDPSDWKYQDIQLAIQTSARLNDTNRMRMEGHSYYLRSAQEMQDLFGSVPGAIENTLRIAERCNVDLSPDGYHLPLFEVPSGETPESYLRNLCEKGMSERYGVRSSAPEVRQRAEHELKIIHDMGFDAYFLIVHDLVCFAKQENIWYNVRGSGAGSLVAYCLDITPVDPLEFKLIFERFLNPGRISMPDIDLDFQDDKRTRMLEYCATKYGDDRVSQIITFNTLGAKGAIRDVGRVMDVPLSDVDRICKLLPFGPKMQGSGKSVTIANCLEEIPAFNNAVNSNPQMNELVRTAAVMEGLTRGVGTHAAGVIITDIPIAEYAPLHRPTSGSEENPIKSVAQFEMGVVERMGLLKVDFLGLVTLTIMQRCCDMIEKRHNIRLELSTIPTDDKKTYDLLSAGNTAGVFQLESSGMTRYIVEMQPKNLDNIIAMVALYRPGPMQFIPEYIACMRGLKKPAYLHKSLEPIFGDTFGVPIYQEQIMFAAMEIGGYSASDADDLRKAISKKKHKEVKKHTDKFVAGAVEKGLPEKIASSIFENWKEFANYGFNKSHAADYGVLAVQTAYLKANYTVEYMTALLTANSSDSSKIAFYVNDSRALGIEVLPPQIGSSFWDFSIEKRADGSEQIRFGMGAVKNVGQGAADAILAERGNGDFIDLDDFITRMDLRLVGRRALESLIKVGAMDIFGESGALLAGLDTLMNVSASNFRDKDSLQLGLFDFSVLALSKIKLPDTPAIDMREKLNWERELLGLFVSDHPLNAYLPILKQRKATTFEQIESLNHGVKITVGGLVHSMRPILTKSNKMMCSVKIEDMDGNLTEVIFFTKVWEKIQGTINVDDVVIVNGSLDKERGAPQVCGFDVQVISLDAIPQQIALEYADSFSNEMIMEEMNSEYAVDEPAYLDDAPFLDTPTPWDAEVQDLPVKNALQTLPMPQEIMQALNSSVVFLKPTDQVEFALDQQGEPLPESIEQISQPMRSVPPIVIDLEDDFDDEDDFSDLFPNKNFGKQQYLTIFVHAESDAPMDYAVRRIQRLHGLVTSFPGSDQFAFVIQESGMQNLVEFPEMRIRICEELLRKLRKEVGESNVRIERKLINR